MKKRISLMLLLACLFGYVFSGYAQVTALSEDFSGDNFPPTDWSTIVVKGKMFNEYWEEADLAWIKSGGAAYLSANAASYFDDPDTKGEAYLILPKVRVQSSTVLKFRHKEDAAEMANTLNSTTLTIKISEGASTTAADFTKIVHTINNNWSDNYTSVEVSLADYADKDIYIAFCVEDDNYGTGIFIDDVEVDPQDCPKPSNIVASMQPTTGTFTWTGTGDTYELQYTVDTWENAAQADGTSPLTITGLEANTTYKYRLRNNCGNGSVSAWIEGTCKTAPDPNAEGKSIPYSYGFEDQDALGEYTKALTVYDPDPSWGGTFPKEIRGYTTVTHNNSATSVEFKNGNCILVTPKFDADLTTTRVRVWAQKNSNAPQMEVGVMTDPADKDTFEKLGDVEANNGSMKENVISLAGCTNGGKYIAFYVKNSSGSGSIYIDDITVEYLPECPKIEGNLTCKTSDHESATLTFTDSDDQTYWILYYKQASASDYTTVDLTAKEYKIENLAANTEYQAYVTRECSDPTKAESSNILTFKTTDVATFIDDELTIDFEQDGDAERFTFTNSSAGFHFTTGTAATTSGNSMYLVDAYNQYSYTGGTYAAADILVQFGDRAEYSLSFDYKINCGTWGAYNERLTVLLCDGATTIGNTRPTGQELLKGQGKTDWTNFFVILPSGATDGVQGKTYKLVFWYEDDNYTDCYNNCMFPAIDNIKIIGANCASPTGLVVDGTTQTSASVVWEQSGAVDSWNVYVKTQDATDWGDVYQNVTYGADNAVLTINNLSANTAYQVKVTAICNGEETASSNILNVRTACGDMTIEADGKYTEGFEQADNGVALCWTRVESAEHNGTSFPNVLMGHQPSAKTGSGSLEFKEGGIVALPYFTNDVRDLRLKFYHRNNNNNANNAGHLYVGVIAKDKLDDASAFEQVAEVPYHYGGAPSSGNSTQYSIEEEFSFTGITTQGDVCIALKYVTATSGNNVSWYVDDLTVDMLPSCAAIVKSSVAVVAGSIGTNTAKVRFTDNDPNHNAWRIYYTDGGTETNYIEVTDTDVIEGENGSYAGTLEGLAADTKYDVWVIVDCGNDDMSDPSATISFRTACDALTDTDLPYTNDFSSDENIACWTVVSPYDYYGTMYPRVYDRALAFTSPESASMIASPQIESDITEIRVKFRYKLYYDANVFGYGKIIVGVMSDLTDENTFEEIESFDVDKTAETNATVLLSGASVGTGKYIAFKAEHEQSGSYGSAWNILIDDVEISKIPDCAAAQTISLGEVTSTTAKLTINDVKETNNKWNLYVVKNGDTLDAVAYDTKEITYAVEPGCLYVIWATTLCKDDTEESEESTPAVVFSTPAYPVSIETEWTMNFDEGTQDFSYISETDINHWYIGQPGHNNATSAEGKGLYTSNDGGKTNSFTNSEYEQEFAYVTIEFGDKAAFEVSFDYKTRAYGNGYGHLYAYVIDPNESISNRDKADQMLLSADNQPSWANFKDTIYGVAGKTKRLVFAYYNAYTSNFDPHAAIDNLFIKAIDCAKPTDLTLESCSDIDADISWQGNRGTDFTVYYKAQTATDYQTIAITNGETATTLTGLTPETTYSVYVVNNCDNTQKSTEITFTTLKGITPIPDGDLVIDFEQTTDADLFSLTKTSAMHWKIGQPLQEKVSSTATTFEKMEGDNTVMFITIDDSTANANSVGTAYATLPIKFGDKTEYEVSFDYRYTQGHHYYHRLRAYLVPSAYSIPITGFPQGIEISLDTSYNWKTRVFAPIQGVAGETYQLVFVWDNTYTGYNVPMPPMIDNIKIKGFDCARPSNFDYTNVEEDQIVLTWKEVGAATSWTLYYGTSDSDMQSIDISAANATINDKVVTYTLNNLVPAAQYQMYVESQCAQNSAPSTTLKITTLGKRVREFPFLLTFEDPSMYSYAKIVNTGSNLSQLVIGSAAGVDDKYSLASHHSIYTTNDGGQTFAWTNSVSSDTVIVGIQFGDDEEYNIEFDYITSGIENTNGMNVWLQPKKEGAQRIMIVERDFGIGINTWRHVAHKVSGVKGEVYDLVFHWYTGGKDHMNPGGAIDNIFIEGSSCSSVDTVMVDKGHKRYITTLPVSWEDSDPGHTSWTVKYKVSGSAEDDQVVVVDNEKSVLLENLNSGEDYDIHVYANCINGDETTLSVGTYLNVNTDCDDYTGGWFDDFAYNKYYNRSTPKCWTRLKSSWGNNWFDQCLYPSIITYAGTGHDPANLTGNGAGDATSMEWKNKGTIATPYFANIENSVFTFWAMANASGLGLQIYVADDVYDTTTWEPVKYFTTGTGAGQISSTDWDYNKLGQIRIPLNQLISKGTKAVVLDYINGTNTRSSLYLDDFRLEADVVFDTPCNNLASDIKAADTETGSVTDGTDRNGETIKVVPDENMAKIVVTTSGLLKNFDYKLDLTGHPTKHAANGTDTLTFTGLKSGTEHTVWIRTYCAEEKDILDPADGTTVIGKDTVETGTTSDWKEFRFKMAGEDNTYCPQVVEVKVDSIGEGAIKISWTASTEKPAQSFRVMVTTEDDPRADAYDGNYVTVANTTSTYTFEGLRANTDYYVYVQAVCSEGDATWEQNSAKTPKIYVHPTVESISLVAGETVAENNASIILTGKYKVNDSQVSKMGFQYRERGKPSTMVEVETTESNLYGGEVTFTKTITGLKSKTEYEFKSFIVDANSNDSLHITLNWLRGDLTNEYIPTKPTVAMVSITDTTEEGATFNGAFTVALATEPFTERGFVYRQINATKLDTVKLSGTGNSAIVTGLTDYTEYEVYAYGKTAYYTSGVNSETMTFRTLAGDHTIYPYELTVLDATNIEAETATLNAEVTAYGTKDIVSKGFIYRPNATTVKYDTVEVGTAIQADKFSADVEGLTPNYIYEVYAYIATEDSTYMSAKHTFKTDKGAVIPPQVTTLPAENVEITTATWRATVVEGNEQIISREFQYWSDDISQVKTTVPAAAIVTASGFYVNLDPLEPNTTYTFRAMVKTESGIYYGNEMTCTTKEEPKVYPVVQTFSASSVAETSATLNGRVNVEGINVTVTEKGFAYKVKGADDATLTEVTVTTTADQITRDVMDLTDNTTYVYYAYAKVAEGDTTIKGTEIEFTTLEKTVINPTITLNDVVAGVTTAKLSATITKGTEDITKSGFRYRKVGTSSWENEVEAQVPANGGVMTVDVDGLEESTSYEFTAFVQTASGEFTAQTPKSFATGSGLEEVATGMSVTTYPNPTTSDATLSVEGLTMDAKVIVSDVNGKTIINAVLPAGQTTMTITTSELSSGVYYVTVISDGKTMTHKLIKR